MGVPGVCPGASTPAVLCFPCKSPPGGWCCASRSSQHNLCQALAQTGLYIRITWGNFPTHIPTLVPSPSPCEASVQLGALRVISCAPCRVKPGLGLCMGSAFSVQGYAEHLRKLFSVLPMAGKQWSLAACFFWKMYRQSEAGRQPAAFQRVPRPPV